MIGKLLDDAVSLFSPITALRRSQARQAYQVQRSYDAAKRDRLNSSWRTQSQSADLTLLENADIIRDRARDLVRNNAYARGALRSAVRNIVGRGIRPQCRVRRGNGDENQKFCEQAEQYFERWQQTAEVSGRLSFYEVQRLAISERWEAGECLIRFVAAPEGERQRLLPLALELIEADRFVDDNHFRRGVNQDSGNEVRRGVELDSFGRAVAYHLYTSHPNGVNTFRHEARRYPASEFIHLFKPSRIGQTRGVSEFAPVVFWMRNLHRAMDNEMVARTIANCFSVAIKSTGATADGSLMPTAGGDTSDANGNSFESIEPGMVARLFPDEDIAVINPGRNSQDTDSWLTLMIRSMSVGMGLSYERLSRDYSKTNYSSNRASDLEDRRDFRIEQQWLVDALCRPVWHRFMQAAVEAELPGMPDAFQFLANYDRWTEHAWHAPGWEWVDPQNEMQASTDAIANNLSTMAVELAERGHDWRDVIRQRAIEKAVARLTEDEINAQLGVAAAVDQKEKLNGAQVQAASQIVSLVALGQMPRDAGVGQLVVLFQLSEEDALKIIGSAGTSAPNTANPVNGQEESEPRGHSVGSADQEEQEVADEEPAEETATA